MKCLALRRVRHSGLRLRHKEVVITLSQLSVAGFSLVTMLLLGCDKPVINDTAILSAIHYCVWFCIYFVGYILSYFTVTLWLIGLYRQLLFIRSLLYYCHQKCIREYLGHISSNMNIFLLLLETFMSLIQPSTWCCSKNCCIPSPPQL
jgi:hypothetical protein